MGNSRRWCPVLEDHPFQQERPQELRPHHSISIFFFPQSIVLLNSGDRRITMAGRTPYMHFFCFPMEML